MSVSISDLHNHTHEKKKKGKEEARKGGRKRHEEKKKRRKSHGSRQSLVNSRTFIMSNYSASKEGKSHLETHRLALCQNFQIPRQVLL